MPFLIWDTDRGRRVWPLTRSMLVVGCAKDADITIDHRSLAPRQALISAQKGTCRVTGLAPGCAINGAALTRDLPSTLVEGDLLRLGAITLVFTFVTPVLPKKPHAQKSELRQKTPPVAVSKPAKNQASTKWKHVALALAFVAVILVAIVAALLLERSENPTARSRSLENRR